MRTLSRIWIAYLCAVIFVAVTAGGGGQVGHEPGLFVTLHALLLLLQVLLLLRADTLGDGQLRMLQSVFAVLGCPATFSAMAWLLPAVHPEALEITWYQIDLRWFQQDLSVALLHGVPALVCDLLQVSYALFYLLPVASVLLVGRSAGAGGYDLALVVVVAAFLASYLGYLLWPTLGPHVILPAEHAPPRGDLGVWLHARICEGEANPWDCFPSGHTWIALCCCWLVARHARRWLPVILGLALPLVFSTVALRYHWPVDVLAGAVLALPAAWSAEWLLERDRRVWREGDDLSTVS